MKEKISALIDQEISEGERAPLLGQIAGDSESLESWRRYHLIGSVIRNQVSSTDGDLTSRIQAELENEPTVIAPVMKSKEPVAERSGSAVVWRAAGLFAVAASVALMAVITLNPADNNAPAGQIANNEAPSATEQQRKFEEEFGEMLAGHGEFSASSGLNGLVAYAKLVSNEQMDY